jgi:hypothetical protein
LHSDQIRLSVNKTTKLKHMWNGTLLVTLMEEYFDLFLWPSLAPLDMQSFLYDKNSVVLVRKRTIPAERQQPADEVSANFS